MQVGRAVRAEGFEVAGATVVLVDQPGRAIADDQRRVAAGTVGDADLAMDGDAQVGAQRHLLTVDRADDVVETQPAHDALELASGVAGDEDLGVLVHVGHQPLLVEVIGVDVRDVQVVGVADAVHQLRRQMVVAGEHEPGAEELREEPRVAADRPVDGVDEDPRVADRGGTHVVEVSEAPTCAAGVVTKVPCAGTPAGGIRRRGRR